MAPKAKKTSGQMTAKKVIKKDEVEESSTPKVSGLTSKQKAARKLADAEAKKKGFAGGEATPEVVEHKMVTIESSDKRKLDISIGKFTASGRTIEVPAYLEGEVRRILIEGGYFVQN